MTTEPAGWDEDASETTRSRILAAALRLLADGGAAAVSTRAVSAAAGVTVPTIYRLFGDKRGLLDAANTEGCAAYIDAAVSAGRPDDPVADLRATWEAHVRFGLDHPGLYAALHIEAHPVHATGGAALAAQIRAIAEAGRLRVTEARAAQLVYAAGAGIVLALLELPSERRDPAMVDLAWDAVVGVILLASPAPAEPGPAATAVALRAQLPATEALTRAERALLEEWLDRIAVTSSQQTAV